MLLPLLMNATNMLGFRSTGGGGTDYGPRKPKLERKVLPLEEALELTLGIAAGAYEADADEIDAAEQVQAIAAKHSEVSHPDSVKQVNVAALQGFEADRLEVERLVLQISQETIQRADDEDAIAVIIMSHLLS